MALNRILSLALAILTFPALAGCTTESGNTRDPSQWMPKGYVHQDETPLSTPAPSSPWHAGAVIHDTEALSTSTAAWQGAAFELVDKIDANLPKDGTPLNLSAEKGSLWKGEQDNSLDHYLRQVLIQRGYNLTTVPDAGLKIVHKVEKAKTDKIYNLTISTLNAKGKVAATATVPAVLP